LGRRTKRPQRAPGGRAAARGLPPLSGCLINANWQQCGLAHILVTRATATQVHAVGFLVDVLGVGLKDVAVSSALTRSRFEQVANFAYAESGRAECSLQLAQELVYGGVEWARRHGLRTPRECLRALSFLPPPAAPPDLSRFGRHGRPVLIAGPGGLARFLPRPPAGGA
jgi:hypothetical protein